MNQNTPTTFAPHEPSGAPTGAQRPVTIEGIRRAAAAIADVLDPTPAWSYPLLDDHVGTNVVLKHENTQPTGAFKVRGGLSLLSSLAAADALPPVLITASTGNHAQSIAYAARAYEVEAVVVMPSSAPQVKRDAVTALGARVITHGPSMTEAAAHAFELASASGWRYVDPGNEPDIIHGHATVTLELLSKHPELQTLYVPVGSGTSAAGACVVRDALAPGCRIIAVQSSAAPAAFESWRAGRLLTAPCDTRASGLATGGAFELPQSILRARLDDFLLVSDDDLDQARRILASHAHTLAEGAGAAGLAGLLADRRPAQRCGVIVSGGNADTTEIASLSPL